MMIAYLKLRSKVPASPAPASSSRGALVGVFVSITFARESTLAAQLPAQRFEPVREARLDRPLGHAQHGGRLVERHLVQVVEDDGGAARGRQPLDRFAQPRAQLARQLLARRRRGQRVERVLVPQLLGPAPLALEVSERLARGDAVGTGAEQIQLAQPAELAVD